ncbi:MAG: hypothetical protein LBQ45_00395 [Mycoplasmataceae bacterium]|nr:hypothetical protein [Mycoplasmataceae bacterium]
MAKINKTSKSVKTKAKKPIAKAKPIVAKTTTVIVATPAQKTVREISPVDFSKLPDVSKYANDKPKNKNLRNLGIIFSVIAIGVGIGIGLFFLINHFAQ